MKFFALILTFFSVQAFAADPQCFEITLTGKTEAGPHPNEEAAVRKIIAGAVENLKVSRYILRAKPANGGFRACIEPIKEGGYEYVVGELSAIAIRESVFDVSLVNRCR